MSACLWRFRNLKKIEEMESLGTTVLFWQGEQRHEYILFSV